MARSPSLGSRLARYDERLLAAPRWLRLGAMGLTGLVMVGVSIPNIPKQYLDYAGVPALRHVPQRETYGTDTISDMYGAKVVLNDPMDMFTKSRLDQTPLEAETWSKEASAPYPPAALLTEAGLFAIGDRIGIGFYGMILALACLFLTASAFYFWRTRWYLFPALYLNFTYFSERFVYVQDSTYLIMLAVVMAALVLARRRPAMSHLLMAVATTMKLSPLFHAAEAPRMPRRLAIAFVAILVAGLVLPYFIWDNYLYIYRYANELKGDWDDALGALVVVVPFALALRYVETRLNFGLDERIGWHLVPVAMFFGLKMNVARHLLIVLLVPDKRGPRNLAAAVGLAVPALLPVPFTASLYVATGLLVLALVYYLDQIGWDVVREDLRQPSRTIRMLVAGRIPPV